MPVVVPCGSTGEAVSPDALVVQLRVTYAPLKEGPSPRAGRRLQGATFWKSLFFKSTPGSKASGDDRFSKHLRTPLLEARLATQFHTKLDFIDLSKVCAL